MTAMVSAVRAACGPTTLKVILETGELKDSGKIRRASELAIAAGADFIKTSTGKVQVNATLEAADIMLQVIRDSRKKAASSRLAVSRRSPMPIFTFDWRKPSWAPIG